MNRVRARNGFTLIELLVVVAIIALLVSIFLPTLARAREQGKQVKCLANLKGIGTAMNMYFTEANEWFPFEKRNEPKKGQQGMHGFYYGGHPGRSVKPPNNWWGYIDKDYRDTPKGRPFNRYIYNDLPDWDVQPTEGIFEAVRKQMVMYKCSNDTGSFWSNGTGDDDTPDSRELFYEAGTSYDANYHYPMNWAASLFNKDRPSRWMQRSNAYTKQQLRFWASRFVIIYEDPFDIALYQGLPRRGWHRQMNRHNLLFLDGHSANTVTMTGNGEKHGPNWKSGSGNSSSDRKAWWKDRDDPDYQYKDIDALPGW